MTTPPCFDCRKRPTIATRMLTIQRAGDRDFHEEVAAYCAEHVVGGHVADFTLYLGAVEPSSRVCPYCDERFFDGGRKELCRSCYYSGSAHERRLRIAALLGRLTAQPGVQDASVWHTGGGCFCLAVTMKDGRFICGTDADAGLPEDQEPWYVTVNASEESWGEGEPLREITDASDDDFVAAVAA